MARVSKSDREAAIERLQDLVKPGETVYTVLRHVSRSGMSRSIDAYVIKVDNGKPVRHWLSRSIANAGIGTWDDRREAVKMGGAGMDMGFALVYELSHRLYPDGFGCIGDGCHSNDHANGDRDYTPHAPEAERIGADGTPCACHRDHWHRDGGYALRHSWL